MILNSRKIILTTLVLLPLVIFVIYGLINPVIIREYEVSSNKISNLLTILQISDLHSHVYSENQQLLIKKIINANPDIIVFTGDIADDKEPIKGIELLLKGLKGKYPMFYVTGNHEYWADNTNEIIETIESYGVIIMDGQSIDYQYGGDFITINGISDPDCELYSDNPYSEGFLNSLDSNNYNILLAHRPERIRNYSKYPIDLVLSGHAHGGQFAIPYIFNGLIAPNQGVFPKYTGGIYEVNSLKMIVSRGLAVNKFVPRFYNNKELVLIRIVGEISD